MRLNRWLLAIFFAIAAAWPVQSDAADDIERFQGTWTMFLVFRNGEEVPADLAKTGELVVEDQEYRATLGANSLIATMKVDASKTPKEIDFLVSSGENKGKTVKGIYKVTGDHWTICRALTEKDERPAEFAAPLDSGLLLVTWKRSKAAVVSAKPKTVETERKRFEGTWRFVEIEADGQKVPAKAFEKDTLVLKGNRFASFVAGTLVHGEFKIDPIANPKTIDIIFTEGPGKGHSQKGIYELQGNTQKICIAMPDQPRPTEFITKSASGHVLQVLKRETH